MQIEMECLITRIRVNFRPYPVKVNCGQESSWVYLAGREHSPEGKDTLINLDMAAVIQILKPLRASVCGENT